MNLNKMNWSSQWAGNWSILSFSYWGDIYTRIPFSPFISKYVDYAICVWEKGESAGYQPTAEREQFAKNLVANVQKDETLVDTLCDGLVRKTDVVLDIITRHISGDVSFEAYQSFQNALADYYPYHISVKYVADFLPEALLKAHFDSLQEARVHAEPVFDRTEEFMRAVACAHEQKTRIPARLILCTTKDEFHAYENGASLPPYTVLEERYSATALVSHHNETSTLVGKDAESVFAIVRGQVSGEGKHEVSGMSAYPGSVRGTVRIVVDPTQLYDFQEGDILVSGMTRPDYLPLMKKAAAFVTDSGGVLCHAAIVAREMKKPCVIGTKIATKVFKDGDTIEVDADRGIVRKLQL